MERTVCLRGPRRGPPPIFLFLTTTVARVVFALPFVAFGVLHFVHAKSMAGHVPVPGGVFWVYATGAGLIAGGLGVLTRSFGMWAALCLALLMLVFIVTIHLPGLFEPELRQMATMNLLKDTAFLGAALTWAGLLASNEQ